MNLAEHNGYIHCVQSTMQFLEVYYVMQGGASATLGQRSKQDCRMPEAP